MTFTQRIRNSSALAIMTTILAIAAVGSIVFLTACGKVAEPPQAAPVAQATPSPAPTIQTAPAVAPVIVQAAPAAPAHDSTMSNMLLGGMLGYMMGSSGNRNAAPPTTVVNRTTVVRQTVVRPAPAQTVRPSYRPSPSTYRPSPSFRSGRR